MVLLVRDPNTLFAFWDLSQESRAAAAEGLVHPKAVFRLFDEHEVVREVTLKSDRGSLYFHNLQSGHRYRGEVELVGRTGERRRWAKTARSIELPSTGAPPGGPVQMLRIAWDSPEEPTVRTLPQSTSRELQDQFATAPATSPTSSPKKAWGHPRDRLPTSSGLGS